MFSLTGILSACVHQSVFEKEFSTVRRIIPEGSGEQCSEKPTSNSIGLFARCVFELTGNPQVIHDQIAGKVPATYRLLQEGGSALSYVRDFGNDNYYLTFNFFNSTPNRTRIELELKSLAN